MPSTRAPLHRRPSLEALEERVLLATPPPLAAAGATSAQYVDSLYEDLLRRDAASSEVNGWARALDDGRLGTGQAARAFVASSEYQTLVVHDMYQAFLGRSADAGGLGYWLGRLQGGLTFEGFEGAVLGSDEYFALQARDAGQWVAGVYLDLLGRPADAVGAADWQRALAAGVSRTAVAQAIAASDEGHAVLIDNAYRMMLDRGADAPGSASWRAALRQGLPALQLPAALADSAEYFGLAALQVVEGGGHAGVQLGANASLGGHRLFPDDNPWNQVVAGKQVDPNSQALLASIGLDDHLHPDFGTVWNGAPNGIPYVVVPGDQPKVPVQFRYASESDPGPYPIPDDPPIEGGPNATGDRHILILDRDNWILYELFDARKEADGWHAGSGAIFDLNSNALRPAGWTSADAAGLPILPGLVRYDEVMELGEIRHALRFTVAQTRRAYVSPATHFASTSTDPNLPPMGMRVRLRADFDVTPFPRPVQVILTALKTYGMIVADNGGDWYLSGAPDPRWDDDVLATIKQVKGSDFEVVKMEGIVTG